MCVCSNPPTLPFPSYPQPINQKGQIVIVERPLLSLQSIGNSHTGALVCKCCRTFIGGPQLCLKLASGVLNRENVWDYYCQEVEAGKKKSGNNSISDNDAFEIVPCRNSCGELYCSSECEMDMWRCCGHELLCE